MDMDNVYRCIIRHEFSNHYIGTDYNGKTYKIIKNKNIRNCKKGNDLCFYAKKVKGLILDSLIPLSDDEAGVTSNYSKSIK